MKRFKEFLYLKEMHDLLYLTEEYTGQVKSIEDIDSLPWDNKEKDVLKKILDFILSKPELRDVSLKKGYGYIAAGVGNKEVNKKFKINSALQDLEIEDGIIFNKEFIDTNLIKNSGLSLEFGNGSIGKGNNKIYKDFKISSNTEFLEFFQALGFSLPILTDNEDTFVNTLQKAEIRGDFKFISNDWDGFCRAIYNDKKIRDLVLELVNGSVSFKKEAGIKNPYVVWNEIKSYYSAMKSFESDIKFTKENTADIVVIEGGKTLSDLISALNVEGQTLSIDKKYGKLTTVKKPVVSWYQISLKEGENSARLGRVTGIFKNLFLNACDKEASNLNLSISKSCNEERKYNGSLEEYNQSLNEFIELYNEGWFDSIKSLTSKVVDKIKNAVLKLKKYITDIFNKYKKAQRINNWNKEKKQVEEDIKSILKKHKLESKENFENKKTLFYESKKNEEDLDMLMKNPVALRDFKKLVKQRLDDVEKIAKSKDGVIINVKRLGGGKGTIKANIQRNTIKMNASNSLSFLILKKMINEFPSDNIMQYVTTIKDDMMMGSTGYPVVKLYGSNKGANYSILIRSIVGNEVDSSKVFPLIIDIIGNSNNTYYVVNVYMISESNIVPEECKFNMLQFTNSDKDFAYKIEGNKTIKYNKLKKKFNI